ncbi:MAG TPA: STAS domain-containing protein [Verrucomicrobiae bacterium]|jgi:anti-sigma B factor antagonist|nr:STAS domain-containing protein [Verrucomicrobiae bacterium]
MPTEIIEIAVCPGSREGLKILRIKGPLNIRTVFDFQNAVRADVSPALVVDFSFVPYIDSTGLGALVGAHLAAERANRRLAFAAMNTQVSALVEMTHVNQFFGIYRTIEEAESAIS